MAKTPVVDVEVGTVVKEHCTSASSDNARQERHQKKDARQLDTRQCLCCSVFSICYISSIGLATYFALMGRRDAIAISSYVIGALFLAGYMYISVLAMARLVSSRGSGIKAQPDTLEAPRTRRLSNVSSIDSSSSVSEAGVPPFLASP